MNRLRLVCRVGRRWGSRRKSLGGVYAETTEKLHFPLQGGGFEDLDCAFDTLRGSRRDWPCCWHPRRRAHYGNDRCVKLSCPAIFAERLFEDAHDPLGDAV